MDGARMISDEELISTFELCGKMIKEISDKADAAIQGVQKIVECMSDAVMGQRRGSFQDMLSSKYSADLGPIDSFYSDTFGNKFSDCLIDELLSSNPENPDEYITSKIGETKGKYGKYLGATPSNPNVPIEEASEAPSAPESAEETGAPPVDTPELEGEEAPEPEIDVGKKKMGKKRDYTPDMMRTLGLKFTSKV